MWLFVSSIREKGPLHTGIETYKTCQFHSLSAHIDCKACNSGLKSRLCHHLNVAIIDMHLFSLYRVAVCR